MSEAKIEGNEKVIEQDTKKTVPTKKIDAFFKDARIPKEHLFMQVSDKFVDEKGEPIEWEFKEIPANLIDRIRNESKDEIEVGLRMVTACTVYPPLNNAELQDSYGVKKPEELLNTMLNAGERDAVIIKVTELNGYKTQDELIEEAKN